MSAPQGSDHKAASGRRPERKQGPLAAPLERLEGRPLERYSDQHPLSRSQSPGEGPGAPHLPASSFLLRDAEPLKRAPSGSLLAPTGSLWLPTGSLLGPGTTRFGIPE